MELLFAGSFSEEGSNRRQFEQHYQTHWRDFLQDLELLRYLVAFMLNINVTNQAISVDSTNFTNTRLVNFMNFDNECTNFVYCCRKNMSS